MVKKGVVVNIIIFVLLNKSIKVIEMSVVYKLEELIT